MLMAIGLTVIKAIALAMVMQWPCSKYVTLETWVLHVSLCV